jgi:hypothetical protein
MEQEIKDEILSIIRHSHNDGIDVNGFGWYLYRNKKNQWEQKWQKDWEKTLRELEVTVNVDADLQRMTNTGWD